MPMPFGSLPPEINSGLMYAGSGAGPLLAAASTWEALAAELHTAAAGYRSELARLTGAGWTGPASAAMSSAAAPYSTWMSATAVQAEQTASQARDAVAAYEAAFVATVPPSVIAANRAQLARLISTNALGQNTPAIAVTEAQYGEMWAQDVAAMHGYRAAAAPASALNPFNLPPQVTDPAQFAQLWGQAGPYVSMTSAGGSMSASTNSIWNSLTSIAKNLMPATAKAATDAAAAPAGAGSLGGLTAALGRSGTIGALSVPRSWAAATPLTSPLGTAVGGAGPTAAAGAGLNPGGLLGTMPMLANAATRGAGDHGAALPRFDLRPSVIPTTPAAG